MAIQEGNVILIHFGELWLRGRNRGQYISQLISNISSQLGIDKRAIENHYDRLVIKNYDSSRKIIEGLSKVFGISHFSVATVAGISKNEIVNAAIKLMLGTRAKRFSIRAHRSYKGLDFNSIDIAEAIKKRGAKRGYSFSSSVRTAVHINMTKDRSYLYIKDIKGLGGLPVGSSGKGVMLFSGGIDSPVSTWYAMKRGVSPIFLHVHGLRTSEELANSKIPKILEVLSKYTPSYSAYFVPASIFQVAAMKANRRYEAVLFKAFLFRLAEEVCRREGAKAIFTGESLGQVASQTPQNIAASQLDIKTPILRPLIGFDKNEIISVARKIGTYELSIMPYKDVCSIGIKNPLTGASVEKTRQILDSIGIAEVVSKSISAAEVIRHQNY